MGIKFLFSVEYLVLVTILRPSLTNLTIYLHHTNQKWMQVVMSLFYLQRLYLSYAIANFTLVTGSIVLRSKFSSMKVVFFYWRWFVVKDFDNVSYLLKKKWKRKALDLLLKKLQLLIGQLCLMFPGITTTFLNSIILLVVIQSLK